MNPASGKRPVTFKRSEAFVDLPVTLPCGRCVGCRLERSRQWAVRCVHEAQLHQDNSFITLTYSDVNLPYGGTLVKKHFQDFAKRVRKQYADRKISYFHCGEYGDRSRRPHYHALLFGLDWSDKAAYKRSADGSQLYTSALLQRLWPAGFCTTGAVTFESAAYCARYVMKKMTGSLAEAYYQVVVPETGEVVQLQPEYITMSLKPAVGKGWFDEYRDDVYPDDFVVMRGREMKPPKYYDRLLELEDPSGLDEIKQARALCAVASKANSTPERLAVREKVKLARTRMLKRELE